MNRMNRRAALTAGLAALVSPALARAQMPMTAGSPSVSRQPTAGEAPFVAKLQHDLPPRFPTVAAAQKAGFFQYTAEDNTGAISYVNLAVWNSTDIEMPNQVWYDVNGRFLGVDYTVLEETSPSPPPTLFGYPIDPSHWTHRGAHMHWGFAKPDGTMVFGAMPVQKFKDAGGQPNTSQPAIPANKAALVATGLTGLTSADQVRFVFLHPAMWDLVVWVLPNPDGAFADANPNVTPSQKKSASM